MMHLLLWFNVLAFTGMFTGLALVYIDYLRAPVPWFRSGLVYISTLTVYQFVFALLFFMSLYIDDIPPGLPGVLRVIQYSLSGFSLYFLPVFVAAAAGGRIPAIRRALFMVPPAIFYVSIYLILVRNMTFLVMPVNGSAYLYIIVLSALGASRFLRKPGGRRRKIFAVFFIMNILFNLLFITDYMFFQARLPGDISAMVLYISCNMLAWTVLFLIGFLKTPATGGEETGSVSEDFKIAHAVTSREEDIIELLAAGFSSRAIGERLFISTRTVDTHVYNIYRKCGVRNRLELVNLLRRYGGGS